MKRVADIKAPERHKHIRWRTPRGRVHAGESLGTNRDGSTLVKVGSTSMHFDPRHDVLIYHGDVPHRANRMRTLALPPPPPRAPWHQRHARHLAWITPTAIGIAAVSWMILTAVLYADGHLFKGVQLLWH
jgi:hypothetical protein